MIVIELPELGLDQKTAADTIENVLQANATNRDLFASDSFMRYATLFESRSESEAEFADRLWNVIEGRLHDLVTEWVIVVPIPRVHLPSFAIETEGLFAFPPGDDAAWATITGHYSNARRWNSVTGHADPRDVPIMKPIVTSAWLACKVQGTKEGANLVAQSRMRTLIALVFASAFERDVHILQKSAAAVPTWATHFPSDGSKTGVGYVQMEIGEILPPLLRDLEVTAIDVTRMSDWYENVNVSPIEIGKRARTAAHFVHYAIVADELEQFLHFFIALDAMFGVRGNVENMIIAGVNRVFNGDNTWHQKARKLFDLRSELLHGGASSIQAWSGYDAYDRHFKSNPVADVAEMAFRALRQFPV